MEEIMSHVSLPVSLGAALTALLVGAIWYNPKVFGTAWMKSIGKTEKDLEGGNMAIIFGIAYALSFVLAHLVQILIELTHWHPDEAGAIGHSFHTFGHGALHGAFFCIGLIAPVIIIIGLFERRSFKYHLINVGYWLVVMSIMGGIVDAF